MTFTYELLEFFLQSCIKDTDFDVCIGANGWCLFEAHSPAGEDIVLEKQLENEPEKAYVEIADWIRQEADSFDVDEHVELWVDGRGKDGIPSTVRELLDDAEDIKEMLDYLATSLER